MDVFMSLPDETRVLPGRTDETTIGREREHNSFRARVARRHAPCVVARHDGKGQGWVRFDDGTDAVVGGSRVER
jgi:hypothetical protein